VPGSWRSRSLWLRAAPLWSRVVSTLDRDRSIWWDPRNGGFTGPSIHFDCVTDHTVTLSAPDAADWVLLLRKVKDC
jgi:hypothetical protein